MTGISRLSKGICALALLFCIPPCFAYHPKVKNYPRREYKAGTQNWGITQNTAGTMYFANNSGILEFDGQHWSCKPLNNRSDVHCLASIDNRIYAGGANEAGYLSCEDSDRMTYRSILDSLGLYTAEIWNICKFDEALVFNDNNNIFILRDGKYETHSFSGKINALASLSGYLVAAVEDKGVLYYTDGNFEELPDSRVMFDKTVCRILPYSYNEMLFVTEKSGVWKYSYTGAELYESYGDFTEEKVFCAAFDNNILALGTISDGIFIKDCTTGERLHINSDTGLQNNTVLDLFFDKDSNLWAGLNNGIDYVLLNSPEKPLFSRPEIYGTGYACIQFGGKLYLGTNQGLFVEDGNDYRRIAGLSGQVWNLQQIGDELFCCHDKGIFIMDRSGNFRHIDTDGAWKVEELIHHPDILLSSSYSGMFTLVQKNGRWQYGCRIKGFELPSKVFEEDPETGEIWFSHHINGLYSLTLNAEADSVSSVRYFSEHEGFPTYFNNIPFKIDGRIMFATEGGFYSYDRQLDKAVNETSLNRKFSGTPRVVSIYKNGKGTYYYSSGIFQAVEYMDAAGNTIMDSLSLKPLIGRRPLGFECTCPLAPGVFIINTEDGFSQIDINELEHRGSAKAGQVYIRQIDASRHRSSNTGSIVETVYNSRQANAEPRSLKLPYARNTLSISFICPGYVQEDQYEYSYKLENYDKEYSAFSEANSKEYTRLPNGKYVFRVIARSRYGNDTSTDSIELTIEAPWFKTVYAYIGYGFALVLFITGIFYATKRIYRMKTMEIMEKNREKMHKKELELELAHKAQDIANSTMNLIRKNEILMDIDSNLQRASDYIGEDRNKTIRILNKIRHHIRENIEHDDDWQKFRTNFDLAYSDYLKRLSEAYPELSAGDLKLCAYLKMGFSSKDMAPLLNMTVRSVEMTRYRLRKKMSMDRETNLVDFLQKF